MTNRRAKIAAASTAIGLAALGGVALGTNPGPKALAPTAAGTRTALVTATSGAAAQPAAVAGEAGERAPIVTRSSGGGSVPIDD